MKKMVILLTLLIPATSLGAPIDTWIDEVIEYAGSEIKTDKSNISSYYKTPRMGVFYFERFASEVK